MSSRVCSTPAGHAAATLPAALPQAAAAAAAVPPLADSARPRPSAGRASPGARRAAVYCAAVRRVRPARLRLARGRPTRRPRPLRLRRTCRGALCGLASCRLRLASRRLATRAAPPGPSCAGGASGRGSLLRAARRLSLLLLVGRRRSRCASAGGALALASGLPGLAPVVPLRRLAPGALASSGGPVPLLFVLVRRAGRARLCAGLCARGLIAPVAAGGHVTCEAHRRGARLHECLGCRGLAASRLEPVVPAVHCVHLHGRRIYSKILSRIDLS